jgi:phenylacetate-CoA ligase
VIIKRALVFAYVGAQDRVINMLLHSRTIHRLLFAPGIENYRWVVGRWRAWRTFELAQRRVPAYPKFLGRRQAAVSLNGWTPDLAGIPEMDKLSYIKHYRVEDRCLDGRIPSAGVIVDESSGSSGTPTSWVRGPQERFVIRGILQVTFQRGTLDKPVFVINAFALGAWATGMNVSMSLVDVTIIKSTGPDITKIVETIKYFGRRYRYMIVGYPPFLKDLADDPRLDLSEYDTIAGFGGEGMSENMRDYLIQSYGEIYGSYGASDLEINIGAENPLTVALRRELVKNEGLRKALTRTEWGILPMIFQYNSFDYVIETNEAGEMVVTITRGTNLSPRIRYNIHDRGHVLRMRELVPILKQHGASHILKDRLLDLPLLFHYGRSDLTIAYYGAKVTPDSVREILYEYDEVAHKLESFRLLQYEDAHSLKHLLFAIELKDGAAKLELPAKKLQSEVIGKLAQRNLDFANAFRIAAPNVRPTLAVYAYNSGPFAGGHAKLKHEYVAELDYAQAKAQGLV